MKRFSAKKGFSIIEVVISLGIISMVIIGVMELATNNIQVQNESRQAMIASQLALESLEIIRNIRDNNWVSGAPNWNDNLGYDAGSQTYATSSLDYRGASSLVTVGSINDIEARLKIDANGLFTNDNNVLKLSPFSRIITIKNSAIQCPVESCMDVVSTVAWSARGRNYTYQMETLLWNWYR